MRRYFLKYGDLAMSGAVVLEGFSDAHHHGVALTYVGAAMSCPACRSAGYIVAQGPRRPGLWMGKVLALSGDLCVCKCAEPSEIMQSQTDSLEYFTSDELASMGYGPHGAILPSHYDEQFTLRDARTRQPMANVRFRVTNSSGETTEGTTDSAGKTHRIATKDAQHIAFQILH